MEHSKQQHIGDTVRIRRPPKVFTNAVGGTVWMSDVRPRDFELCDEQVISTDPYDRAGAWLTS